ncbi:ABC transporter ATP-binding protein [Comamonadaceae bacterium G21597-S1]|nr:ABC transporter ATP-binding protein [Comamonadaceae bacterium G21597-S1]
MSPSQRKPQGAHAAERNASATPAHTHLLEARGIVKRFGGLTAVNDVSLHVNAGEICSLIGPNGAGKTTFFNLMSGVLEPSEGLVLFHGRDMAGERPERYAAAGMGRTFQNLALFRHSSVIENLLVGRHSHIKTNPLESILFYGRARREEAAAREKVERIVEFLEIESLRDKVVGSLSYGQQKRVELGRALASEPSLLLLDEIVAGMNREEKEDIARFILDIRDELGITVLMIEHDMQVVMDLSDRIYVLDFGCLIAGGTPAQIMNDPAVTKAYLGDEAVQHA